MKRGSLILPALAGVLVGCSSTGLRAVGTGEGGDAIVGGVYLTTSAENGYAADRFDVNLQTLTAPGSPCAGAAHVVGACCYFAPTPPPPLQVNGGGGTPATEASAGTLEIVDTTTGSTLGTYQPGNGLYVGLPANYAAGTWSPGDELTVSASGGEIDAFSASIRALAPASASVPTTVALGHDLVVSWAPDPASDTMSIGLLDSGTGAVVACTVPEAQGTVTIDASLFASFNTGAGCQATAIREAQAYAQTPAGRVLLASFGWASGFCTVQ